MNDVVGVSVGGVEDVVLFLFVELMTKDGGDVFWGGLWDIYIDQEGSGSGRVVGVNSSEAEVFD